MLSNIWTPHGYQRTAGAFALARPGSALFLDPGLGKTSISLAVINGLKRCGLSKRSLIVAPLRVVYSTWPAEVRKWAQFAGLRTSIIHGTPEQRTAAMVADADVYLTNPSTVPWLAKDKRKNLRDFDALFVDESTKFKNPTVKAKSIDPETGKANLTRWASLRKILPEFDRRTILTGTPMPNTMIDLWTQIYICDFGERLGRTISAYREKYFTPGPNYRKWNLKPFAQEEIQERIADIALVMDCRDLLEMPDLTFNDIRVRLPSDVQAAYNKLDRELYFESGSIEELAKNAGSKYNMARQIVNGGLYVERDSPAGRKKAHVHDAKIDAVEDLSEELNGKPLMIVYHFEHERDRLLKRFGNVPVIGGGGSPQATDKIVRDWNERRVPILLCQPQAMSHGLNMQDGGRNQAWLGITDDTLERAAF